MKVHWAPASTLEHCQLEPQLTAHYPEETQPQKKTKRERVQLSCAEHPPYVDAAAASMKIQMSKIFSQRLQSRLQLCLATIWCVPMQRTQRLRNASQLH